jgi:hypothetical protein
VLTIVKRISHLHELYFLSSEGMGVSWTAWKRVLDLPEVGDEKRGVIHVHKRKTRNLSLLRSLVWESEIHRNPFAKDELGDPG